MGFLALVKKKDISKDTLNNQLVSKSSSVKIQEIYFGCEVRTCNRPAGPIRLRSARRAELHPRQQQLLATDKQIDKCAGDKQPVRILLQPAIAHFHEPEPQLEYLKHGLHLRPHLRLRPVLRPSHFVHDLSLIAPPRWVNPALGERIR